MRLRPIALVLSLAVAGGLTVELASSSDAADGGAPTAKPARRTADFTALRREAGQKPASVPSSDHAVPFADDSAWFLRADTATELAPDSAAQVANLAGQVNDSLGHVATINAFEYNTSIYRVPEGTPRTTIGFDDCQHTGFSGDMFTGRKIFVDVPMPADAVPSGGTDGQLSLYDPQSDTLWDFWQLHRQGDGWAACWGGRIDDVAHNRGYFQATEGASASGMAIAGGAITIADVERGYINHALNIGVRQTAGWQRWTWPAMRADGTPIQGDGVLEQGQRLRLDPSVDVNQLGLNRLGTMIAKAAQEYGIIVTDTSGQVAFVTESGDLTKARTGENPWSHLLGTNPWQVLDGFPWDKMQALPKAYGR